MDTRRVQGQPGGSRAGSLLLPPLLRGLPDHRAGGRLFERDRHFVHRQLPVDSRPDAAAAGAAG